MGGGRSFIRTTAAGGTGNTPPGTGCKPGAMRDRKAGIRWDGRISIHLRANITYKDVLCLGCFVLDILSCV